MSKDKGFYISITLLISAIGVIIISLNIGNLGVSIFLASSVGPQGPVGTQGPAGVQGPAGENAILVEMYINETGVPTNFPDSSTWVKVAGTTLYNIQNDSFTHSNNRFTYIGTTGIVAHGFASFSFSTSTTNEDVRIAASKNGNVLNSSIMQRGTGRVDDVGTGALNFMCMCFENDYLEIVAMHLSGNGVKTATFKYLNVGIVAPH